MSSRQTLRVLIVNPFGIGDVLFTTPLIRAVRRAFPECHLGYLGNKRTAPILRTNPHLNELFIYEKDDFTRMWRASWRQGFGYLWTLMRQIRRSRYDVIIDLSLGERYALVLWLLGVRRRLGFNFRGRGRFLTDAMAIDGYQGQHVVDHYRALLRFLGFEMREPDLEVVPTAEDAAWAAQWLADHGAGPDRRGGPLIGCVPAGGVSWGIDAPFRRWTLEGFAAVADAMVERYGATVLLFGEQSDAPVCREVQRLMRHRALDVSGRTSLGQFVGLLGRLDLVVCNDGGPLHLAVSQRVKTVSIFGPVSPKVYGPFPADRSMHRAIVQPHLPCRPCYHQFRLPPCPYERACLTTLEPDDVREACEALLGAPAAQAAR